MSKEAELFKAAKEGKVEEVTRLLAGEGSTKGADVNCKGVNGWTPLHLACMNGKVDVVALLIKNNANIEAKDEYEQTPLHFASMSGHVDVVSLLLKNNANIEAKDISWDTPMHEAAFYGILAVMQLLRNHNANINAVNNKGKTALMLVVENNQAKNVEKLLQWGADPTPRDYNEMTALRRARLSSRSNIEGMIRNVVASDLTEMINAKSSVSTFMPSQSIGDQGVVAVGSALPHCKSIKFVSLRRQGIRDAGAKSLASGIELSASMETLDLLCNEITDEGAAALVASLQTTTTITSLNINDNKISTAMHAQIATLVKRNQTIMQIKGSPFFIPCTIESARALSCTSLTLLQLEEVLARANASSVTILSIRATELKNGVIPSSVARMLNLKTLIITLCTLSLSDNK